MSVKLVPGSWFPVPGSRFPVPGSWFPVPGSRFQVLGSCFPVPCFRFIVPGSLSSFPGSRSPVPDSRFPGYRFSVSYRYMLLQYIPSRIHYLQANYVYLLVLLLVLHDDEI